MRQFDKSQKGMGQDVDVRPAAQASRRKGAHEGRRLAAAELHEVERLDEDAARARHGATEIVLKLASYVIQASQAQPLGPLSVDLRVGPEPSHRR